MGFFENHFAFWLLIPAILFVGVEFWFRKQPAWLLIPRVLWILCILFLVANWKQILSREYSEASLLRVFIDQSDSVRLIPERQERAEAFYREVQEWAKAENQPIEIFSFSDSILPLTGEKLPEQSYSERTRIAGIQSLPESAGNVVILSDGNFIDSLKIPNRILSLQIGEDSEKDVWIEDAPAVLTAFLKNRIEFRISLGQRGFDGERVELRLKRGREILDTREVRLAGDRTEVDLSYFPEKMGEQILELEILADSEELSPLNNRTYIRLRTVRDKIRLLHISGKPSLDLKAWRLFLTRQPDVDLVSFYILRSLDDDPMAKNSELSLIPFPYEELFTTELEKFDIVILQNFNFNLYFQPFYLRNLARFVEAGGALLMMGGDQSFQNYQGSPLEELFPFEFEGRGNFELGSFEARVLESHPIIKDLPWVFQRPKWGSRHRISKRADAETLVAYSDNIPMLSFREAGEGRVLTINTDETWRLQFQKIGDYIPFSRFARRVLQFLTFDPEMESKRLVSGEWKVGRPVDLRLSNSFPADWGIFESGNEWKFTNTEKLNWIVPKPGVYEVQVSELPEAYQYETEEKPWLFEWKYLVHNNDNMKQLAEASDGLFISYEDRQSIFQESLSGRQIISSEAQSWNKASHWLSWGGLLAIICLLCLDFFLRKKHRWDA